MTRNFTGPAGTSTGASIPARAWLPLQDTRTIFAIEPWTPASVGRTALDQVLLSSGRHNRASGRLLPMRSVAGVDSLVSRPP